MRDDPWDDVRTPFLSGLADRVLAHLEGMRAERMGEEDEPIAVDRYTHSLQSATRALRLGADEEYVVCALLHDIGDVLGAYNHAEVSAAVLRPFVSEANAWMVRHHADLQRHRFVEVEPGVHAHFLGLDPDAAAAFRAHPAFRQTVEFCERVDQRSYEPGYETLPIDVLAPMVRSVFRRPRPG
jgi:predicted HD phosphohydrolase